MNTLKKVFIFIGAIILCAAGYLAFWLWEGVKLYADRDFINFCSSASPFEVEAKIRSGANINAKYYTSDQPYSASNDGSPILVKLAYLGTKPGVFDVLIKAGSDVNARDNEGRTALMWAAFTARSNEAIPALIRAEADVNAKDNWGETALMYAVKGGGSAEIIAALINAGADVNAVSNEGKTALTMAEQNVQLLGRQQDFMVVDSLRRAGARR